AYCTLGAPRRSGTQRPMHHPGRRTHRALPRPGRPALAETSAREVHEETGWLVAPQDLRPLGFHYRMLDPPYDRDLLHPDFLQVVFTGEPYGRDASQGAAWADVVGWEQRSESRTYEELEAVDLHAHER